MKKGLLSILAGALVVVGCQNYDDQFDNLESQISALASTVAGLSQVQSDLASLAGTVASLSSTVNGLGSAIDTAVSNGLADIQADIDAIDAAVADVASSEEVSALSDAVADAQTDLTDLLAASSVFTGDVVVNSAQTLDAFHKMGAGLNIVNGNVNITVSTDMDQSKVQELVNNILTTVGDYTYTSAASSIAETTFDNLTGTRSLTVTQGGGIRFPNLVSATNIYLKDDFESTVTVIHFGSLTTVAGIDTDAEENTIRFTKATELHLTSLAYYPPASLTIETDEGAAMPFALDDLDADGDELEDGLTLSIKGPASVDISKIADGSITLEDVASVTLTDFKGSVTLTGDVESFTSNSLVSLSVTAGTKIETVDVTGVADPDATTAAPSYGPAIDLDTLGDLETVSIAGIASSINLGSNGNLTTATISADVAGSVTVDNNSDLTTLTVTGAKATALDVDTNADLESLTVDLTWRKGTASGAVVDGDLDVTDNASLTSLTVSSNNLENLEVTGNDELTTIDFTGVDAVGATGTPVVNVYDNDLTATKLTDTDDGATDVANGKSGDLGSATTTSGMKTLKAYLTAVAAATTPVAAVYFDTVESFVAEDDSETTDVVYSSNTAQNAGTVLLLTAGSGDGTPAGSAIKAKRAFIIDLSDSPATLAAVGTSDLTTELFATGTDATTAVSETIEANSAFMLASLQNDANVARFAAYNLTIASSFVANSTGTVSLIQMESGTGSNTVNGERYVTGDAAITTNVGGGYTAVSTATNYGFGLDDTVTFGIGGNTVTVSPGGAYGGSATVTTLTKIAEAIVSAYGFKYGKGGTASGSAVATITASAGVLSITMLDKGTAGNGVAMTMSVGTGTVTATNAKNLDYVIGSTNGTSDNDTVATDVLVTLTHNGVGTDNTSTVSFISSSLASMPEELTTTRRTNTTSASDEYTLAQESADAIAAEGSVAAVGDTTPAVSFSRVAWL
jgi:hypothetical protein